MEIDGATLKKVLEHAAEFYASAAWQEGRLVLTPKEGMIPYNFDVIQGAGYRIDPTAPVGSRIKDLMFRGRPVKSGDRFTLAVNSYRAQGSGGYVALKGAKVVKFVTDEIRDLVIARLRDLGHVSPVTDHNWVHLRAGRRVGAGGAAAGRRELTPTDGPTSGRRAAGGRPCPGS